MTPELPWVIELSQPPAIPQALKRLAGCRNVLLLDSSLQRLPLGRYSFLMAEPFKVLEVEHGSTPAAPFAALSEHLRKYHTLPRSDLPPFQGGAAGLLSYELGRCFEQLPLPERDEFKLPAILIGLYDWVLAWDHQQQRCWFIAHGFPKETPEDRLLLARQEWDHVRQLLEKQDAELSPPTPTPGFPHDSLPGNPADERARDTAHPLLPGLRSNFTEAEYLRAVRSVVDKIKAGDIFQANLSQRFLFPAKHSPITQYLKLREENPAPFAGFFTHDDWAILSSSPERFLQLRGNTLFTRPIKGTRQRSIHPEADLFMRDELRESEKDRSENIMIVDLLRNDLSRVCLPGSIRVSELCSVEAYETVSHLVSEVHGTLRAGKTFWDAIAAVFPGGSITGAPKIRAMEIITELEQTARGAYCGSLCYHGFDGTADSSILIRTMVHRAGWLTFSAGGGIVSLSDPRLEYEETLHKARGMLRSLMK